MKLLIFVMVSGLSLLSNSSVWSCSNDSMCGGYQQNTCRESQNYCQCTDVNAGKNPCLSKTDYCHDFGNAGDNEF
jgi:hypothetical protein